MKIQNFFNTGKMNKDVDERLVKSGEFLDARNIRILNTASSDAGAIENEKGNVQLTNIPVAQNPKCIGSVSDEAEEKIYWAVVNSVGYSYIFEYDAINDITSTVLADERTGDNQVLNFDSNYKITGFNVVYNASKKSKLLLFTDGLNPPRMVDIKRAKGFGISNFLEDDISLYKKPPRQAPVVKPFNSLSSSENAVKEQFFAFGYRYRYLDGGYSAPSSFSYFQFTPKNFQINFTSMENKGMDNIFNGYKITYNSGDKRVTDVQLLFKYSTDSSIFIIDSINKEESSILDDTNETYEFTNKKIFKTLPKDEVFRIFDNVPLTAKAQDFINDRIVFGNTTSQYDVVEAEGSNDKIKISYDVSLDSVSQEGNEIVGTLSASDTKITFDLSGVDLLQDKTITFILKLESAEAGTAPDDYFNGSALIESAFVITQDYANVTELVASSEFTDCVESMTGIFQSVVITTPPPDPLNLVYGSVSLDSSTSTTFTLLMPVNVHTVDDTPADATDNDDPAFQTDINEVFTLEDGSNIRIKDTISNVSLKSNRSFEVGLCYLDKDGRYSSILLPKESLGESISEVFVPIANSVNLNKLRIKLFNNPPYWADRYKWFVKVNKGLHFNIYATIFYEDQIYRWILLQGANLGKLEVGKNLVVKADDNGPLQKEVKTKILEITTKNATDEVSPGQGWISGNADSTGEPLVELAGTFVKIRPNGFTLDFNPDNFLNYERSRRFGRGGGSGTNTIFLPNGSSNALGNLILGNSGQLNEGILQVLTSEPGATLEWSDIAITPGTQIKLELVYSESDGSPNFNYFKEWTSNNEYTSTATRNALQLFFDSETNFTKTEDFAMGGYDTATSIRFRVPSQNDEGEGFKLVIAKSTSTMPGRWVMRVQPTEGTATFESSRLTCNLNIILVTTLGIFETEPEDIDNDIYYETEETFLIENGFHKGNEQDQTSSQPAISKLGFGNCFSFGNGAESVRVKDDRFLPAFDIKSRPNIAIVEGYERKEDTNKLIYSGPFNENSGYNTLNEFNSSRGITKYMDMKYGSIQKLFARESDLIVFQEDRVSKVLYGKNILTSPDGTGSLSQIEQVLGQDVPFSGEYGISLNPESFGFYEGKMYFADANRGTVLRLGGDGITPISYIGMKSFFKENLYNNKNNFNIGGFDPKYHQYVLSMSSTQMPSEPLELDCASVFTKTLAGTFTYSLNVGQFPGTATVGYSTTGTISISIVYNGNTYSSTLVTGTGTVTFPVTSADLETTNIATVQITPVGVATATITHICPVPETLEVVLIVVNDSQEANETIINRYKHNGSNGNNYNSELDVFDFDELTRFETISGPMGGDVIPDNGDTVTISSLKQIGVHTGDFNSCNSLGYLVSEASLTVQNVVDQATYPAITNTTTSTEEENVVTFTFNRTNTSQKLYLVWNYIDNLPVLVNDTVTGIANGGSSTINVVANDTIPSPFTISIGTPPTNGTAVVNANNTITYTHTAGNSLNDSFTYIVSRGGACTAEATVTTEALAITVDTYIYIYFDDSGSMANTEAELQTMRAGALKSTLQDLYATGGTESSGNTNSATNGSDEYDDKVTIVYGATGGWTNERTFAAIGDNDVNDFLATNAHNSFPSDAANVIVMVFQDEASAIYHDARTSNSFNNDPRTNTYNTDMADLRSRVTSLNTSNSSFYRGVVFQVEDVAGDPSYPFRAFLQAVEGGTASNYTGTNGLSDLMTGSTPTFVFEYDIEDSSGNDATAPFKPGSTTDRFDQWQYYYLYWLTNALNTLGFTPDGVTWPIIIDD
ncbi:MAG: putative structural protein [Prokaryotic dsDNA virus sp.]|nr:MAG: putative structural protein [Prokaryotic dsDNA virus sp.]